MRVGLDVGSTTVKCVVLDENNNILYSTYERHYSQIKQKIADVLRKAKEAVPQCDNSPLAVSGSSGMGLAEVCTETALRLRMISAAEPC